MDTYYDPDRQAMDADLDPDPAKWRRSDRIRIHNTTHSHRCYCKLSDTLRHTLRHHWDTLNCTYPEGFAMRNWEINKSGLRAGGGGVLRSEGGGGEHCTSTLLITLVILLIILLSLLLSLHFLLHHLRTERYCRIKFFLYLLIKTVVQYHLLKVCSTYIQYMYSIC